LSGTINNDCNHKKVQPQIIESEKTEFEVRLCVC